MKIRTGFVSNSSSSSFILRVLAGSTEKEIRAIIEEQVGEMKDFFMPTFRQELIDTIMERKGDKNEYENDLKFELEWLENHPDSDTKDLERYQAMRDDKFDHYHGGFSDNGEGAMQYWLCETNFKIETDDFFMENNSGY
jgi:hypothetical protein